MAGEKRQEEITEADTQREGQGKTEAETGGMSPQAKGCQMARSHQKLADTDSPTELPEETNLVNTLISDFWLPELCECTLLLLQAPSSWYFVRAALGYSCGLLLGTNRISFWGRQPAPLMKDMSSHPCRIPSSGPLRCLPLEKQGQLLALEVFVAPHGGGGEEVAC